MRRLVGPSSMLAVALAIVLVAPSGARAQVPSVASAEQQLTVDYSFDRPHLSKITIDDVEYDRITMTGCASGGRAGEPALPACGAQILVPLGTEVAGIEIAGEPVSLGDGYLVEPLSHPVRLSADADAIVLPTPDLTIYGADAPFPASAFEEIGTYGFRGYQILTLKLHPVVYLPTTGELSYYPQLTVTVDTVETGRMSPLFRGLEQDEQEMLTKVDNPAQATSYPLLGGRGGRGYDLLIITTSSLSASFQPLKSYHDAHGIATEIHTTTEIGGSDPETVRAYITDRYNTDGISYVIIGADDDLIPAPNLYVEAWSGGDVETAMPGDVYFGCLDGTWNYDGDSRWGEPTDGPGGGDVDLVAEVYVGRACGGNTTEITRFVDKTLWYLNGGHTQPEKVLLVGEYLGFGGASDYAAGMMEQLIDGSSADGYTTVGIPSSDYVVDELFERDMSWSQSDIINRIDAGVHMLNHLGHGSPDYAMKLYDSDISSLSNTDLCFVYSQTCLAGHFDGTDCWAEYMNIKTDNGGYAVIMNARYGWGTGYSTDGPNQRFNREFWDAVYDEGKAEMGPANHDSKEDNLYRVNEECMRWCYYEINLFGDPTVAFRGVAGLSFAYPAGIPETVLPGETTVIEVVVSGTGDGVPVSGSGQLHYSIDGGGYVAVDMDETSANHYEATLPALSCGSTIAFYFTAEEVVNGTYSDPAEAPGTTYSAFPATGLTVAFADDFEANQGWTAENLGATSGDWQRGVPVNDPGWDYDPASDSDGSGQCYLTQNQTGNTDVDDGAVRLTSPTIDMSTGGITISYDYYLYLTNSDGTDRLLVEISSNGDSGPWTEIARHDTNGSLSWRSHAIDQNDLDAAGVTLTANMKIRFTANDGDAQSIVEAGLDAFQVISFSCDDGDEYTLTVNITGSGTVTKDPDQATYTYGQNVELTATPDIGWSFDHWSGDLTGSSNPDTIAMDGDKTVTAVFVQDEYTLTVNITGNGSVTKDPDQATYTYGQNVELTATPDIGWSFDHWSGDLTGSTNPDTIAMDGDKTVTAVFVQDEYTLTVNITGNGSVTKDPDQATYTYGQNVELTATPDIGWSFDYWAGDLTGSSNPDTIAMDGDKNVTAVFVQDEYTLTINVVGQGTVTKDPDQATYTYGQNVELTATPDIGWSFDHWSGDLTGSTNPDTIAMDGDKTVTAVFVQDEYTLTVNITGSGSVTKNPDQATYTYGQSVELTANADAGWYFDHWEGDLTSSTNPDTIAMDGDKTVTAVFAQYDYTLTVNIVGQGTVDLDPPGGTYPSGTMVELTANADPGWYFDHWEGDLTGSTNPDTIVMTDDMTVTVVFEADCYGDINGDGRVNLSDLAQLLSNYGMTGGATYQQGDLTGEGDINLQDLAELLSVYGTVCW